MATYEATMFEDRMFEHAEDTEMAVDPAKYPQHDADEDIELDFVDHVNHDEMMTEDNTEPTHDLELGDAAAEQDAEMTDESASDDVLDEEILDAPVAYPSEHLDPTGVQSLSQPETQRTVDVAISASETEPTELSHADEPATKLPAEVPAGDAVPQSTGPGFAEELHVRQEEEEELITWESDEEDEHEEIQTLDGNVETHVQSISEVPESSETTGPLNLQGNKSLEIEETEQINDDGTTDGEVKSNGIAMPNEEHDQGEAGEPNTHDHQEDSIEHVEPGSPARHQSGIKERQEEEEEKEARGDQDTTSSDTEALISGPSVVSDTKIQSIHDSQGIEALALEALHPIVIRYMGQEMSLFPPTMDADHTVFFLNEKELAFDTCQNLFKAFRKVLGDNITKHELLVLKCPLLGLEINEILPEASTLSIAQLLHLHLGLLQNDANEESTPLLIELNHYHDISARLNELYALMSEGKGYSALNNQETSREVGHVGGAAISEESENIDEDGVPSEVGYSTPHHQAQTDVKEDEPDFSSPAAVHTRHHANSIDTKSAREDIKEYSADFQEGIVSNAKSPHEEFEINYEDDEDAEGEEEHLNDATVVEENIQASSATDVADTMDTNVEVDEQSLTTTNTDNSATLGHSGGRNLPTPLAGDSISDGTTENADPPKEHPQGLQGSAGPTEELAGSSNRPDDAEDFNDFEEIDYSDHESLDNDVSATGQQTNNATSEDVNKPNSPKRSYDEEDDSTRNNKRLRSS